MDKGETRYQPHPAVPIHTREVGGSKPPVPIQKMPGCAGRASFPRFGGRQSGVFGCARALFTKWRDDQDACAVSVVNLAEVLIAPSADVSKLAAAREAIAALGVTAHQPNEAIGVEAARLRGRHPISLPDAYCLATAKHTSSAVSLFDQKILKAATREGLKAA
jgi:predicted nucleic acid-binding protein